MGFTIQLITEIELPDLTGDQLVNLTDVSTAIELLDGVMPETHVKVTAEGYYAEVTSNFPIIDLTGDKKVDLSDISRVIQMFESATVSTRVRVTK